MRTLLMTALLSLTSTAALAQFHFAGYTHRGNGCPQNTVSFVEAPDGKSVSVLYDNFNVQLPDPLAGQVAGSTLRRRYDPRRNNKACNISFNVQLEAGQSVEALKITVYNRGAAILDQGVTANLSTRFLGYQAFRARGAPQSVMIEDRTWRGEANEDWLSNPVVNLPIRSGCASGAERGVRFDMMTALDAQITNGNLSASALVTMDSSDVNAGMKIRVITRACGGRMAPELAPVRHERRPR